MSGGQGFQKGAIYTPKRHVLSWNHVVWAILHQNRSRGVTSRSVEEKKSESHRGSHRKDMSPLTQGLNYRSPCDSHKTWYSSHPWNVFHIRQVFFEGFRYFVRGIKSNPRKLHFCALISLFSLLSGSHGPCVQNKKITFVVKYRHNVLKRNKFILICTTKLFISIDFTSCV